MTFKNKMIELAEKYSLKEKALSSVEEVIDAGIESDEELGIDFLEGNKKSDLIYEFGRYELRIDKDDNCLIATKINIYSKKLYSSNFDVPVGFYTEIADLNGQHIDEFLTFDWSMINYNTGYHIEKINKAIPQRYFRRNVPEYEFVTYVNHIISSFQGRLFDVAILFIERSLNYLEKHERKQIDKKYLDECFELFNGVYQFIKNDNLVDIEKINKLNFKERMKTKS